MVSLLKKNILKRKRDSPFLSMVVTAAGSSTRMGTDKIFAQIDGRPVLFYSLYAMEQCSAVSEIIVVVGNAHIDEAAEICTHFGISKAAKIICGGDRRMDSVWAGVMAVSRTAALVGVHDGARPFVTSEIIEQTASAAASFGAAVPAVAVKDTIKCASGGVVKSTPDRNELFAVQTPQIFEEGILKAALEMAISNNSEITDDAMAVEKLGVPVHLTQGSYENIKLTTPSDMLIAKQLLEGRPGFENWPRI